MFGLDNKIQHGSPKLNLKQSAVAFRAMQWAGEDAIERWTEHLLLENPAGEQIEGRVREGEGDDGENSVGSLRDYLCLERCEPELSVVDGIRDWSHQKGSVLDFWRVWGRNRGCRVYEVCSRYYEIDSRGGRCIHIPWTSGKQYWKVLSHDLQ